MDYKVIVTAHAKKNLNDIIQYISVEKKNVQAARSFSEDFRSTTHKLSYAADVFRLCENPGLKELGYRRINLQSHKYFIMYRIKKDTVIIDGVFHFLQDFEKKYR